MRILIAVLKLFSSVYIISSLVWQKSSRQNIGNVDTFIRDKLKPWLTFNLGLALKGFRTTGRRDEQRRQRQRRFYCKKNLYFTLSSHDILSKWILFVFRWYRSNPNKSIEDFTAENKIDVQFWNARLWNVLRLLILVQSHFTAYKKIWATFSLSLKSLFAYKTNLY